MKKLLAPLLYKDENRKEAEEERLSVVAKAKRSQKAKKKAQTKRTEDNLPVHSFQGLLENLGTISKNIIKPKQTNIPPFEKITRPTRLQEKAFELLGIKI